MNPGGYTQPRLTLTHANFPIVTGKITGRLYAPLFNASGYPGQQTRVLLENIGSVDTGVQLTETANYVSGPRVNIGGVVPLAASGYKYVTFTPTLPYLEVAGAAGYPNSQIRMQIEGQVEWSSMAFSRAEDVYPPELVKKYPDPSPPEA